MDEGSGSPSPDSRRRELALRLLSLSGSMSGLSIGAVSLFRTRPEAANLSTIADDLLAICALLFLCTNLLSFWALRGDDPARLRRLAAPAEILFVIALVGLVGVGFLMVYTVV